LERCRYHLAFESLARFTRIDSGVDFIIQSNSPFVENPDSPAIPHETFDNNSSLSTNDSTRINSWLYMALNTPAVKAAFRAIVSHAARHSGRTEQHSFDEVLCRKEPSQHTTSTCTFQSRPSVWQFLRLRGLVGAPTRTHSLRVHFLNRFEYPVGAILVGPQNQNVYELRRAGFQQATKRRLLAAHNNWIVGEDAKEARQRRAGWWFSPSPESCFYLGE